MEEMESTVKPRAIRADKDSYEKFRLIAEEFPNQAQALAALVSMYEIQKSKALIPERQTEIENFSVHIQSLNEMFNQALLLNRDAEARIRAEFQRQIDSKDIVIQDLQDKISHSLSDSS